MTNKKEKIISKKDLYKGRVLTFSVSDVVCPNGTTSIRETVHHNGGVCILAEFEGKIILERQYRFPYDDFIYELPAGKLEKGEDPYQAGIRELEEEVGLKAGQLISYGEMYPSVGYTDEIIYLFVAKDIKLSQRHLDPDEYLEVCYFTKDELLKMINENVIKDAKTLVLLLKYFNQH